MTTALGRLRQRAMTGDPDRGFTLIESVVALMIATVVFTALAASTFSAFRVSVLARQNQQAADFLSQRVEQLRLLDFASVGTPSTDATLASDSYLSNCAGVKCIDPGTGTKEKLVLIDGGSVSPHVTTVNSTTANKTVYTLYTYVTDPADGYAGASYYRRVTVVARWTAYGSSHARRVSTMFTYDTRGLPLPSFKFTPIGSTTQTLSPGSQLVYGMQVFNQGAPDRWNITKSDANSWTYYLDDGDGVYEPGVDTTLMTDTTGDGIIDTGRLDPNTTVKFWAVRTISVATADGTYANTFTATSYAQPAASGAAQSIPTSTVVTTGVVTPTPTVTTSSPPPPSDCSYSGPAVTATANTGYTLKTYTLHNLATPGNSTTSTQVPLDMTTAAPAASSLYEYSTDLGTDPGRLINPGGTFSTTATDKVVDWRYPIGKHAWSGTAKISLYGASKISSPTSDLNLTAYVYTYTKSGATYTTNNVGSVNLRVNPFSCAGYQNLVGAIPLSVAQLGPNDYIGVKVVNNGPATVRIAYDVVSQYPASIILPEK